MLTQEEKDLKAAELVTEELTKFRSNIEANQKALEQIKSEVGTLHEYFKGDEYTKTAAFKEKTDLLMARIGEIEKTYTKSQAPKVATPGSTEDREQKEMATNAFFKNLRRTALIKVQSKYEGDFRLSEKEIGLLERKNYISQNSTVAAPSDGKAGFVNDEVKAAMVTDNQVRAGAALQAPQYMMSILNQNLNEISSIRQYAKGQTTSNNAIEQPVKTARGVARWIAKETSTKTEDTNVAYNTELVPLHEMGVIYKVSQTQLEDSAFNLRAELLSEYTEAMDLLEGTALVSGSGSGEPEGFMSDTNVPGWAQGEAAAITNADAIIQMPFQIKDPYARSARFYMKRQTMGKIVAIKDGTGNYLLRQFGDKARWFIAGYPVSPTPDMPAIAADTYPIVFGDMKKAYTVLDKTGGMMMIVDPFSSKNSSVVEFMLRRRVGGQVLIAEALLKLKVAVSL